MPHLDLCLNRLYLHSDAPSPRLRIGVMLDSCLASRYVRQILEDIRDCNFAQLACVIENRASPMMAPRPSASRLKRIVATVLDAERRKRLLYRAYLRWIDSRYRLEPDPVARVDCTDLLMGVARIEVVPQQTRFVDRFPADAVAAVRALDLDVILRFGFRILRGDVLFAARNGVWSFHHDDSSRYRGGPPQLWELIEQNPITGAVLQRLDDALDAGPILGFVNLSSARELSVSVNRFDVYWATQHLVIQKLNELHRHGPEHLARGLVVHGNYSGKKPIYRTPDNFEMGRWLVPTIARKALGKLARLRPPIAHWQFAVRRAAEPLHRCERPDLASFTWLRSPRGRFWADPFLIARDGATWAFFENYDYATRRAVISCGRIDESGAFTEIRTALDRPYHLSYPHVFQHDGEAWMTPESRGSGAIELYRARRFPDEWVLERRLIELSAVDPTPFRHGERWWLFASPGSVRYHVPLTLLYTASELHGPWSLHPARAICSDVRWARSAGQVFMDGDCLVRPSQDCSQGYGYSVSFNRIARLNELEYAEEHGRAIAVHAPRRLSGWHTYNRAGDWEVIDGRFDLPRHAVL
jgi:hypothetical protein